MVHIMIGRLHTRHDPERRKTLAALTATFAMAGSASAMGDPFYLQIARTAQRISNGSVAPLRMLVPNGSETNLYPVISAFKKHAMVDVELISVDVDQVQTELALDQMTNAEQFDLALPATFELPNLVDTKAIIPLGSYAEKYEPKDFREDFLFDIGDFFDGESYGFQTDGDAYLMFFNKDFLEDTSAQKSYLEKYDQPLEIPQTWSELDRQIAFFNQPDQGRYGATLFRTQGYVAWEFWVRLHAKGLWPFTADMMPQISHPKAIEALEEMIAVSKHLAPEVSTMGLFENWQRFAQGDVYCNIGWGGSQKHFNSPASKVRGKLAYAATPGGILNDTLVHTPYFNWGWNYVVTSNSQRPELAYLFALFASTPEVSVQAVRAPDGFFDPYLEQHYADKEIQETYSPEFLKIHQESMQNAIPDLYLKDQANYFRVLGEQLFSAINGDISAKDALVQVDRRWRLITSRAGKSSQILRWNDLREKYPPSIKPYLNPL